MADTLEIGDRVRVTEERQEEFKNALETSQAIGGWEDWPSDLVQLNREAFSIIATVEAIGVTFYVGVTDESGIDEWDQDHFQADGRNYLLVLPEEVEHVEEIPALA